MTPQDMSGRQGRAGSMGRINGRRHPIGAQDADGAVAGATTRMVAESGGSRCLTAQLDFRSRSANAPRWTASPGSIQGQRSAAPKLGAISPPITTLASLTIIGASVLLAYGS
jgi:hypothetical protein